MKCDIEIQKTHNLCCPRHTSQIHFHWFVGSQPLQVGSPAPHCCISTSSPTEIWGNGVKLWKKSTADFKLMFDSHRWPICYWQASSNFDTKKRVVELPGSWKSSLVKYVSILLPMWEFQQNSYPQVSCRSSCIWRFVRSLVLAKSPWNSVVVQRKVVRYQRYNRWFGDCAAQNLLKFNDALGPEKWCLEVGRTDVAPIKRKLNPPKKDLTGWFKEGIKLDGTPDVNHAMSSCVLKFQASFLGGSMSFLAGSL